VKYSAVESLKFYVALSISTYRLAGRSGGRVRNFKLNLNEASKFYFHIVTSCQLYLRSTLRL
jgi:hypothetical protein